MNKPMNDVIPTGVKRYTAAVETFQPEQNTVTLNGDDKIKCVPPSPCSSSFGRS